jgi:hypothetical protein
MGCNRQVRPSREEQRAFKRLTTPPRDYKRAEVAGVKPLYDKRLIGTWQSDARKSRREVCSRSDLSERAKRTLLRIFGKLRLRYTRTRVYCDLQGFKTVECYRIVAKNSDSVVVTGCNALFREEELQHVHFEQGGKYYWISLGKIREYFRRIE